MMNNKGYTLVEILVVLGIVSLLSGLMLVYSRQGERVGDILRGCAQVVSDVNRVKNMAITAAAWRGEKTCGYGIYFDTENNRYSIYTVIQGGGGCGNIGRQYGEQIETIEPPRKFTLLNATVADIFFKPPQPTVYFDGQPAEEQDINLQSEISFSYLSELKPSFKLYINTIGQTWAYPVQNE